MVPVRAADRHRAYFLSRRTTQGPFESEKCSVPYRKYYGRIIPCELNPRPRNLDMANPPGCRARGPCRELLMQSRSRLSPTDRIGSVERGELGRMVAVRRTKELAHIVQPAGASGSLARAWLVDRRRIGPVIRTLEAAADPLFCRPGLVPKSRA
jgi:hypothetical protein